MAVDSVKCALNSASNNTKNKTTNVTNCLVLDCGVMTNVCSPGLAHSAQSQSPTRPQSLSPSLNTSAELNNNNSTTTSSSSTLLNSSAMQQFIENNLSSSNLINSSLSTSSQNSSSPPLKQSSPINQNNNFIDTNSQEMGVDQIDEQSHLKDELDDEELVVNRNSPSSRLSNASPNNNLAISSNSNHSSQFNKDNDRKEVSLFLF